MRPPGRRHRRLGCSRSLWLDLARRRGEDHPSDSIAVYQREIEAAIGVPGGKGYAAAVELVGRVADLMERHDLVSELRAYLVELRSRHGRKRNLIKLLDRQEADWQIGVHLSSDSDFVTSPDSDSVPGAGVGGATDDPPAA